MRRLTYFAPYDVAAFFLSIGYGDPAMKCEQPPRLSSPGALYFILSGSGVACDTQNLHYFILNINWLFLPTR